MNHTTLALGTVLTASLIGCGGGGSSSSGSPGTGTTGSALECRDLTRTSATPAPNWEGSVFTIVMENKGRDEIIGSPQAPYINELARQGGVAMGYRDPNIHPSEPNYIWMVAGQHFGIDDDADPKSHPLDSTTHLADQLELADLTWKSYQESMGAPCGLVSHGTYAAKHNPFVYFTDINGWDGKTFQPSARCQEHVVDYSELDRDLAASSVPKYAFITPNMVHDMHDGSIADADRWLANELPKILASDAYKHNGVVFLMWDEGSNGPQRDEPPFIVISPNVRPGTVSNVPYDTTSYLKTVQAILGLDPVPCSADPDAVATMNDLFAMPMAKI